MKHTKKQLWRSGRAAAVALVIVTLMVVYVGDGRYENALLEWLYKITQPLRPLMQIVTQLGSLGMLLTSIVVAFAAKQRRLALQIVVAGGFAVLVTVMLKSLVARPRPFDVLDTITQYDALASGYGFPSGHTAVAVVLVLLLLPLFSAANRWMLVALGCLVALSRITLGVHAPLDIIGGALIGYIAVRIAQTEYPLQNNKT